MWEKHLKKKLRKGPASLLKISLRVSSVSACANQPPGFSASGTSTPNGLFQTINGLKRLVSYSKRLLIFHVSEKFAIYHDMKRIYPTLTSFTVLFLPLLQLIECLSGYMCGHKLTIKFPTDLHNCTGLNGPVNSFPQFTITPPPNELVIGCKPHWSVKKKKKTSCEKWLLGGVPQKSFPKYFSKFTERHLWGSLFLTLLKVFSSSGLQLY